MYVLYALEYNISDQRVGSYQPSAHNVHGRMDTSTGMTLPRVGAILLYSDRHESRVLCRIGAGAIFKIRNVHPPCLRCHEKIVETISTLLISLNIRTTHSRLCTFWS